MSPSTRRGSRLCCRASSLLAEIDTEPYHLVTNQTPSAKLKERGLTPEQAAAAPQG